MVSVCIATYNGGKYIKEQLDSIIPQLASDDEIIISDDGSKDNTLDVINSYGDERIHVVHNEHKHGFVGNFENAMRNVHGDYVFFCDQDDVWTMDKVKKSLSYLQEFDLIVHNALLVDGNGVSLEKTYYDCLHRKTGFWMNLWKTRFLGCCMVMKRSVVDYCLPFPKNMQGHDYWVGMMALAKYRVRFVDDVLMHYRRHGGNLSSSSDKSETSLFYKIFVKRLPLFVHVVVRMILKKKV